MCFTRAELCERSLSPCRTWIRSHDNWIYATLDIRNIVETNVSLPSSEHSQTWIKASEILVAPRISECFGVPWSALVCYSLPWSAIVCLGCCWFSSWWLGCCWLGPPAMQGLGDNLTPGQFDIADNLTPRTIWHRTIWHQTIWHRGQFDTADNLTPDNLTPWTKTDNLTPRTIWQREKTDDLTPR